MVLLFDGGDDDDDDDYKLFLMMFLIIRKLMGIMMTVFALLYDVDVCVVTVCQYSVWYLVWYSVGIPVLLRWDSCVTRLGFLCYSVGIPVLLS